MKAHDILRNALVQVATSVFDKRLRLRPSWLTVAIQLTDLLATAHRRARL